MVDAVIGTKRKPFRKDAIRRYWAARLVEECKFDSVAEVMEADYCWGCGMAESTVKAHILPLVDGGADEVENIHLLCEVCHKQSEFLSGAPYWVWLKYASVFSRAAAACATNGLAAIFYAHESGPRREAATTALAQWMESRRL